MWDFPGGQVLSIRLARGAERSYPPAMEWEERADGEGAVLRRQLDAATTRWDAVRPSGATPTKNELTPRQVSCLESLITAYQAYHSWWQSLTDPSPNPDDDAPGGPSTPA